MGHCHTPGLEFLAEFKRLTRSVPSVLKVHDLRAQHIGPDAIHAGVHSVIQSGLHIEEADRIAHRVYERGSREMGCHYCVIHVDAGQEANGDSRQEHSP